MKNIALLLISILVGAITAPAQTLFSQKFSLGLGEINNIPSAITTNGDTLLLVGGPNKAVLWTGNQQMVIQTTGLEGTDLSIDQRKVCTYFNNQWWVGGNFSNATCKYLAVMDGATMHWTSPYTIDGSVKDFVTTTEKLYIFGDFKTINGDSVYHIAAIDLEGNITPIGNQTTELAQSGIIFGDQLYVVEGEENVNYPEQKLKKYNLEGHSWEQISLPAIYQPGKVRVRTNVLNQPILVGEFMDQDLNMTTGILTVGSDSMIDCHWPLTTDVWKGMMMITGVIDRIDGNEVETCNLNYIDTAGAFKAYDDNGCVGYGDIGTPFMGHYAMIGSIDGDGADIYIFDTAEFTITAIIDEIHANAQLKLYPNPATDVLTLEGINGDISVFNILGQQIAVPSEEIGSKVRLDIGDLPTGIYTIVIVSKDARSVGRFEKIK